MEGGKEGEIRVSRNVEKLTCPDNCNTIYFLQISSKKRRGRGADWRGEKYNRIEQKNSKYVFVRSRFRR